MIEETMCNNRKSTTANKENHPNSYHPYNKPLASGKSAKHDHLAKLSDEEKDIIWKCNGCFKCWKSYVPPGHIVENCPDEFPLPETYQVLTWDYTSKVKAARTNHAPKNHFLFSKTDCIHRSTYSIYQHQHHRCQLIHWQWCHCIQLWTIVANISGRKRQFQWEWYICKSSNEIQTLHLEVLNWWPCSWISNENNKPDQ